MAQPNILFIMTDQQRGDALGIDGNEQIHTPNLDRLGREGVVFDRAYTPSPECVPARAVMMTGLPPHRTGCYSNGHTLSPDAETFQRRLRRAGYLTQAVGKMHFKPAREGFGMERLCLSEELPASPDDDEYLRELIDAGFGWAEEPHGMRSHMYYIPQVSQLPDHLHTTTWTGRKTVEFIEEQAGGEQPWLCWTGFIKPHPPFDPTVPFNTLYDPVEMPLPIEGPDEAAEHNWYQKLQNTGKWMDQGPDAHLKQAQKAHYWACVSMVDRQVGRILDALERSGQAEETLVVFTSDHGEFLGDHGCWGKRSWYEGPGRVPMLVRWPGRVPAGERRSQLVGLADLMPTFMQAAGLDVPDGCNGVSLLEVARDDTPTRDILFGQLGEKGHAIYLAADAEWKYIYSSTDGKEQLLHTAADPDELTNHADDPAAADVKARLREALFAYFEREGYAEPVDGGKWRTYEPSVSGMERALQIGKTCHGITAGYRQYAAWNGRSENLFTPEGRMDT